MLDKTFDPAAIEERQYAAWENAGAFACGTRPAAQPYCIMMPPPNVTGSLHMGHALNFTLQDVLARVQRMRGYDVLWQPGTDHAGIATQMVVERSLAEQGESREQLGREKFLEKVWAWKAQSGGAISNQLRRLGASPDWSRERFTMDEGLSAAVSRVFVTLYREGLIYRDKRLVNWDPKLHTAISDLEVDQHEENGRLWYFAYPVEGETDTHLEVATTRPETMLGDAAVAVHPEDERYQHLIGRHCVLPLVGRRLPIVADEHADPERGSGAVKITPAHDFNDFEVGRRHDLAMVNIFDRDASLNDNAPEAYRGLNRYEARERVLADMENQGLVGAVEHNLMQVPYGDRSGVVIEPWLTDQWFVDAATLARPCIEAVERGETVFVPRQWENTFFEWLRNIQPWCISRQIWWGHRIPAWYGPDGDFFVAHDAEEAQRQAEAHYGEGVTLTQDPDVLDTWFSSALWPFSTLGWPEETQALERYYPTDDLVTGFDIIFFWVARMMMMGLHFQNAVPFRTVYIHALVRDAYGQKMSKSKGNVMDPLDIIQRYGADALRFTLAALAAQGRDIKMSESRVEGYRNFATKLWNAARFCEMNECRPDPAFDPRTCEQRVNRWIVGKATRAAQQVDTALAAYRFNDAAQAVYQFTWNTFCDWYVEFAKPVLYDDAGPARDETRRTAAWVLDVILRLLHPFMPFVTEELWSALGDSRETLLINARWPALDDSYTDAEAEAEMDWVAQLVGAVRAVRAEMNVPPAAWLPLTLKDASAVTQQRVDTHAPLIKRLARLESLEAAAGEVGVAGCAQEVVGEATAILPLADVIDLDKEKARLEKEMARLEAEMEKMDKKLANEQFLDKAPAEVVADHRERRQDAKDQHDRLQAALERITA